MAPPHVVVAEDVGVGVGAVSLGLGTAAVAGDSAALADLGLGAVNLQPGVVSFEFGASALADIGLGAVNLPLGAVSIEFGSALAEDPETVEAGARDLPFVVAHSKSPIADGDFEALAPNSLQVGSAAGLGHPSLFCSVRKAPALALSPIYASPHPTGFFLPE